VTLAGRLWRLASCAVCVLLTLGCEAAPSPTQSQASTPLPPPPSIPSGITVVDPRLRPAMVAISQHPDWAPGSTADLHAHRAVATFPELCVEVLRPALVPLSVTLDVDATPWEVKSIVVLDPATAAEPSVTYEDGDPDGDPDLCRFVLAGSGEPFPADPALVEVNGGVQDPQHAAAIARAMVAGPHAFGVDRTSRPAINLFPVESGLKNVACYEATVFQGGPRATVTITLLRDGSAWRLHHVRITRQALHTPGPVPEGAC
jgi:hypothetical protein